jgi:hypothetical protein
LNANNQLNPEVDWALPNIAWRDPLWREQAHVIYNPEPNLRHPASL